MIFCIDLIYNKVFLDHKELLHNLGDLFQEISFISFSVYEDIIIISIINLYCQNIFLNSPDWLHIIDNLEQTNF